MYNYYSFVVFTWCSVVAVVYEYVFRKNVGIKLFCGGLESWDNFFFINIFLCNSNKGISQQWRNLGSRWDITPIDVAFVYILSLNDGYTNTDRFCYVFVFQCLKEVCLFRFFLSLNARYRSIEDSLFHVLFLKVFICSIEVAFDSVLFQKMFWTFLAKPFKAF